MKKLTQKWCIVSFLENITEGCEFEKNRWPLHITLADVHAAEWKDNPSLMNQLERVAMETETFTAKALQPGNLGPYEYPTKVTFIDPNQNLVQLHEKLISILENEGAEFNVPEFNRKGFIPHCTIQNHAHLEEGEKVTIDNLALIDMFPNQNSDRRKVTKVLMLQSVQ